MDIHTFKANLRSKTEKEIAKFKKIVPKHHFTTSEWKEIYDHMDWIERVRDRSSLCDFFNYNYSIVPPGHSKGISANEILKTYNMWKKNLFTELELECITHSSDELMEYLLMFAPDKSIKYEIYYGFIQTMDWSCASNNGL